MKLWKRPGLLPAAWFHVGSNARSPGGSQSAGPPQGAPLRPYVKHQTPRQQAEPSQTPSRDPDSGGYPAAEGDAADSGTHTILPSFQSQPFLQLPPSSPTLARPLTLAHPLLENHSIPFRCRILNIPYNWQRKPRARQNDGLSAEDLNRLETHIWLLSL